MVSETEMLRLYVMKSKYMDIKKKFRFLCLIDYVERPVVPSVTFNFASYTDANSELEFRFDVAGVRELCLLFRIPVVVVTSSGDSCSGIDALCVMLARLAYPKRYYDMMKTFGRGRAWLCRVFLHMIDFVHDKFEGKIFMDTAMVAARMEDYCKAIKAKGAPTEGVFGFPDGTKLAVCRPAPRRGGTRGENLQKHLYSGHKRCHCLNYQAVTAPDGMCIHFWGPMEGRRHDSAMLRESGLLEYFDSHNEIFDGKFLYGDPAYGVRKYLVSGYKGNSLAESENDFNREMSRLREAVEWNFKCMKTLWPFIDFKKQQKVRLSPVGKLVKVAMLLTNCHNCYYGGNQISQYFGLRPPSLRNYLLD